MIGLTGGIASGKSSVSNMLRELGATIFDADQLAREVIMPHTEGWEKVAEHFPQTIQPDGQVDRKLLGDIVFTDPKKRTLLEGIIHPLVISTIFDRGYEAERTGQVVVADIPLLYETGCESCLDEVWVVYVDEATQLDRLVKRSGLSPTEARLRIQSQLPLENKRDRADHVIDNSRSLEDTRRQVEELWRLTLQKRGPLK